MKLCVALDLPSKKENLELARSLKTFDIWLKVGLRAFVRDGYAFLEELRQINPNYKIFLDLKLHDIPNTMADTAEEIAKFGINMFNIHASAGEIAMKEVVKRLNTFEKKPLILAVTALTSFDQSGFQAVYNSDIKTKAIEFAKNAYECKLDGVVSSCFESKNIKSSTNRNFLTLCPGIRPFGESVDDQKRVATIEKAKEELVDFIVVGRPIYKDKNPSEIVQKILNTI